MKSEEPLQPLSRQPQPIALDGHASERPDDPGYDVHLEILEQPVKPSRRSLCRVSVVVSREGVALDDADVSVGFEPVECASAMRPVMPGELLLVPSPHPIRRGEREASLPLRHGTWRIGVRVNQAAVVGFVARI